MNPDVKADLRLLFPFFMLSFISAFSFSYFEKDIETFMGRISLFLLAAFSALLFRSLSEVFGPGSMNIGDLLESFTVPFAGLCFFLSGLLCFVAISMGLIILIYDISLTFFPYLFELLHKIVEENYGEFRFSSAINPIIIIIVIFIPTILVSIYIGSTIQKYQICMKGGTHWFWSNFPHVHKRELCRCRKCGQSEHTVNEKCICLMCGQIEHEVIGDVREIAGTSGRVVSYSSYCKRCRAHLSSGTIRDRF